MNYPGTPEDWAVPITQNLYASLFFLIIQTALLVVLRWLDRYLRNKNQKLVLYKDFFGFLGVSLFPALCLYSVTKDNKVSGLGVVIVILSFVPLMFYALRFAYSWLALVSFAKKANVLGIHGVTLKPGMADYRKILESAAKEFMMMGVGADKLTRDVDVFRGVVNRCGSAHQPVRLLLIHPDAEWVADTAQRRGLAKNEFRGRITASLARIKLIKSNYAGNVEVRFYTQKPIFRLIFLNGKSCLFGQYTETAAKFGENEYDNFSNPNIEISASENRAHDLELYGAMKDYFEQMWRSCEGNSWDFKTFVE
ncbi:MAG: hypothetical protein E6Q88_01780 [Lysobacteraceae bacterium]|nr:MAG: hypothetical protein E6Q88_01780 [Xanthomonadaceae bacterium]